MVYYTYHQEEQRREEGEESKVENVPTSEAAPVSSSRKERERESEERTDAMARLLQLLQHRYTFNKYIYYNNCTTSSMYVK